MCLKVKEEEEISLAPSTHPHDMCQRGMLGGRGGSTNVVALSPRALEGPAPSDFSWVVELPPPAFYKRMLKVHHIYLLLDTAHFRLKAAIAASVYVSLVVPWR